MIVFEQVKTIWKQKQNSDDLDIMVQFIILYDKLIPFQVCSKIRSPQ